MLMCEHREHKAFGASKIFRVAPRKPFCSTLIYENYIKREEETNCPLADFWRWVEEVTLY